MYKEPIKELDTKILISEIVGEVRLSTSLIIVPGEGLHCSNYKYQLLAFNFHSTTDYNIYKTSTTRLQQHNSDRTCHLSTQSTCSMALVGLTGNAAPLRCWRRSRASTSRRQEKNIPVHVLWRWSALLGRQLHYDVEVVLDLHVSIWGFIEPWIILNKL